MIGTDVDRAARLLAEGRLVAFATETVYGLGADALDPLAVARVFDVKGRPRFDPLIVHVADVAALQLLVADIPEAAGRLCDAFWPGPLTLVLPKRDLVPDLVTAGLSSVAVRIPDHPLALELIHKTGRPVAAPSANPFGRVSPTTAAHVAEQLGAGIDYILDGGPCRVGLESTVLDCTQSEFRILRYGGLAVEEIEAVVGPVLPSVAAAGVGTPQASPGMLTRHYAPQTPLLRRADYRGDGTYAGLLCLTGSTDAERFAVVEVLSPTGDLTEAAAGFFAALRRLDASGLDAIIAEEFPDRGLGRALNDRLARARVATASQGTENFPRK